MSQDAATAATAATAVRRKIATCTSCTLHTIARPVYFSGSIPSPVAIIGEAPGEHEARSSKPFVGPAGRLLREVLAQFGNDPESFAYLNRVSCWPGSWPGKGNPDPHKKALAACEGNLKLQLAVIDPDVIVLAGAMALHAFMPGYKIGQMHGRPFLLPRPGLKSGRKPGGSERYLVSVDLSTGQATRPGKTGKIERVLYPILHPAAALHQPSNMPVLTEDVRRLTQGLRHGWLDLWPDTCLPHNRDVERYDDQGAPECLRCVSEIEDRGEQLVLA